MGDFRAGREVRELLGALLGFCSYIKNIEEKGIFYFILFGFILFNLISLLSQEEAKKPHLFFHSHTFFLSLSWLSGIFYTIPIWFHSPLTQVRLCPGGADAVLVGRPLVFVSSVTHSCDSSA